MKKAALSHCLYYFKFYTLIQKVSSPWCKDGVRTLLSKGLCQEGGLRLDEADADGSAPER